MAAVVALVGCTEEPDPHEVVECEAPWVANPHMCEAACAAGRFAITPGPCSRYSSGMCDHYVEFDGVGGCCEVGGSVVTGLVAEWQACP